MALINALNTAITGIAAQQQRIDVIGNNLANVDTTGFKGSRALFQTIMSQTLRFGTAPQGNLGGINAKQLGLGVDVAEIARDFSNGPFEATGIATDLAIDGDGFFVLRDHAGRNVYTRAGAFTLNPQNVLHNAATGMITQGYMADFETFQVPSGGPLADLNIPIGELTIARATRNASFDGNLNAGGSIATLGSVLESEQLFDGAVSADTLANDATLLTDLVRSSNGTSSGNTVDLNIQIGDQVELNFEKGGRTSTRSFEVGAPPPWGGLTLGDLRDFIEGALGIATGGAPGQELFSAVRQTPNTANANQMYIFDAAKATFANDDALVIDVGSNFGIGPQVFYFDDGVAAGYGGAIQGAALDQSGGNPAHTRITLAGLATLSDQIDALVDAINAVANAAVVTGPAPNGDNAGLQQLVRAERVQVGGQQALKLTAVQPGPNGNLITTVNELGPASEVSNFGVGQLQGGSNAVDVNGTLDLQGARATMRVRIGATTSTGGNASMFANGETLQFLLPDGTTSVTITASTTGPTTGSQFEIYNLGPNATASNLQTLKNLANAINQNANLAPHLNASVEVVGSNLELVLQADTPGASTNSLQVTGAGTTLGATTTAPTYVNYQGATLAGPNFNMTGGGTNLDSVQIIRNNTDGTIDVAFTADSTSFDFPAAGVQIGDYIRFGSGEAAGTIGVITAVGQDTTNGNAAARTRIEFKVKSDAQLPSSPGGQTWFIHEAAGTSIGTGTQGEDTADLDPASARGALRLAGNVGTSNALRNVTLVHVAGSGARQNFASFRTLTAATGESTFTQATVYDSLGNPHTADLTFYLESTSNSGSRWRYLAESDDNTTNAGVDVNRVVGSGTIEFDVNGQFVRSSPDEISIRLNAAGSREPLIVTPDFTPLTAFASDRANTPLGDQSSEAFLTAQDGFKQGTLQDFTIAVDGLVTGSFTNGLVRTLGQVALARFNNNGGLIDIGNSNFREGVNSGVAQIGAPGNFGRGILRSGFLEESNVDLSQQFTELIVAQRAFQANARTVTASDLLLNELVNLVR